MLKKKQDKKWGSSWTNLFKSYHHYHHHHYIRHQHHHHHYHHYHPHNLQCGITLPPNLPAKARARSRGEEGPIKKKEEGRNGEERHGEAKEWSRRDGIRKKREVEGKRSSRKEKKRIDLEMKRKRNERESEKGVKESVRRESVRRPLEVTTRL